MPLKSFLFAGNARLEKCLISNPAHVVPGDIGPHVGNIQVALEALDDLVIETSEKERTFYGPSTAAAVLAYKTRRQIINRSYQTSPDNIVGVMTMARLDQDMFDGEGPPAPPRRSICRNCGVSAPPLSQQLKANDPAAVAHRFRNKIRWDDATA